MARKPFYLLFFSIILIAVLPACTQATELAQPTKTSFVKITNTPVPPTATSVPISSEPTVITAETIKDIDSYFTNLSDHQRFSGSVLIEQRGQVLLSQGYGLAIRARALPNSPQTKFRIYSMTKQFTAMAIMILESQGKLNVQDHICDYYPECPTTWQPITIEQLLTQTSGIHNYTDMDYWKQAQATTFTPEETILHVKNMQLDFSPGTQYSYSNTGYIILGYIIEHTSGQTYEDFLQQYIFIPLDMHDTGFEHDPTILAAGYKDGITTQPVESVSMTTHFSAGALYSTIEDLYKWDQGLYTQKIIAKRYLDEIFTPRVLISAENGWNYGYGWIIASDKGRTVFGHAGDYVGYHSLIVRYPGDQITFIVLSNQEDVDTGMLWAILSDKIFGIKQ